MRQSAEVIVSAEVEVRDRVGIGDRRGERPQRARVVDAAVGPVPV
jgi:hypothetical protein